MANLGYTLLRIGFTVAPIAAGLDKFFNFLTDWSIYLSPDIAKLLPVSPEFFMRGVGVVEIVAGIIVWVKPRIGGFIVAAWLLLIIINFLMLGTFFDIALRDVGLMLGALSLAFLSEKKPVS